MPKTVFGSDGELIAGIINDEDEALETLYKKHYPAILHFIIKNNGSEQEAKDVYQEAVIIFYEKVKDGKLELNCAIKTFLYSICRRIWLKRLNEKSRFAGNIEDSEEFVSETNQDYEVETEKKYSTMADAMELLGEPCKTLISDFYLKKLSMQEITEKFGYTNSDNAKTQKYKCLMRLKKLFFSAYQESEK